MKRELPRAKRDSRNLRITSIYERFKSKEYYHSQERSTSFEITQRHREIYESQELPREARDL